MNTFIADKNTGKIIATLTGPKEQHNIEQYGEDCEAIEWEGDPHNKKAELIDDVWQIVDDMVKVLEDAINIKVMEIKAEKSNALNSGVIFSGEQHDGVSWQPAQITFNLYGADYIKFRTLTERIIVNGKIKPEDEDGKLLRGRSNFKLLLPSKKRIVFNNVSEAITFVEQVEDKLALADIIEQEKISEVYDLQSIDDINNYDATDWSELNG